MSKKIKYISLLIIAFLLIGCANENSREEPKKAMISFVFDTQMQTQLSVAKPLFDKRGWKFALAIDVVHLTSNRKDVFMDVDTLQNFIRDGYEIINHSKYHIPLALLDENIPQGRAFSGVHIDRFCAFDEIYGGHISLLEDAFHPLAFLGSNTVVHNEYLPYIENLYSFSYTKFPLNKMNNVIFNKDMNRFKLSRFSMENSTLAQQKGIVDKISEMGGGNWMTFSHHEADDIEEILEYIESKNDRIEVVLPNEAVKRLTGYSTKYNIIKNDNLIEDKSFLSVGANESFSWYTGELENINFSYTEENRLKMNFKNNISIVGDVFSISQTIPFEKSNINYIFSIDLGSTAFTTENIFNSYLGIEEYDIDNNLIKRIEMDYSLNVDISERRFFVKHKTKSDGGFLKVYIKFKTKIVPSKNHYFTFFKPKLERGEEYSLYE